MAPAAFNYYIRIMVITPQAQSWLDDPSLHPTSLGCLAVRQILGDAQKIGDRCVKDGEAIKKAVAECNTTMDALCEMRKMGKVTLITQ